MDSAQVEQEINAMTEMVITYATTYGMSLLGGILILLFGLWAARTLSRWADKALRRAPKVDDTLRPFLCSLVRYFVLAVTILAVLSEFGVQTASLIAVFGAAGLAIGLALQGTLSNVAAGVMLLMFRPFKVGDYIVGGGESGTVKAITLFTTELATPDNVQIIVPNSQLWGAAIHNFSHHATRRVDIAVGIGYEDDINKARETILSVTKADARHHADPEPVVVLTGLGESSVDMTLRVWCNADDFWPMKFELTQKIKEALDKEGINIPFPQRTVHLVKEA